MSRTVHHKVLAWCNTGPYRVGVADVNVRAVPDDVVARLREQATAEGVSMSEWIRLALADRAALPTAGELAARRVALAAATGPAQSRDDFDSYYRARLHRRPDRQPA
jgi:plasmid stability protein